MMSLHDLFVWKSVFFVWVPVYFVACAVACVDAFAA
jgi:hypothetical protein